MEDNNPDLKKEVTFDSGNLANTKAKEKREIFVNVGQKKTIKQSAEEFQRKFAAARDRVANQGANANGEIKSKKPIPKKPFVIALIIIILGAGGYLAYPTIKSYFTPTKEKAYKLLQENPRKGVDYYYRLYTKESNEE